MLITNEIKIGKKILRNQVTNLHYNVCRNFSYFDIQILGKHVQV